MLALPRMGWAKLRCNYKKQGGDEQKWKHPPARELHKSTVGEIDKIEPDNAGQRQGAAGEFPTPGDQQTCMTHDEQRKK